MAFLQFLDGELKSRPYVAGADFTVADITALVAVDFMRVSKLAVPETLTNLKRWHAGGVGPPERGCVPCARSRTLRRRRTWQRSTVNC